MKKLAILISSFDCTIIDAVVVLQEEAYVACQTVSIGIVVIAAIADQDTDIITEVVSKWTLYTLIVSFGLANCREIGDCCPKRRISLKANFIFK